MRGKAMAQRGTKSSRSMRRGNLRRSLERLERLLAANFATGDTLVTLAYDGAQRPRSRELAGCHFYSWIRAVRTVYSDCGKGLRYAYGVVWATDERGPMYRVILNTSQANGAALAALWPHGPASAERLRLEGGCHELAALLMRQALEAGETPVPCRRVWGASRNIIKPE